MIKNKSTYLCGNWLLQNNFINNFCEIRQQTVLSSLPVARRTPLGQREVGAGRPCREDMEERRRMEDSARVE